MWSGIASPAASIPTEAADHVGPYIKTIHEGLGNPVAAVRDKGDGITNALEEVFPGIYIIACHFHFLQAVGTRLFVPNVEVMVNGRQKVKKLPRTNNILEQEFRSLRRHGRRVRGDWDVEPSVQKDGVGLAIAENLKIKEYVRQAYLSLAIFL